MEIPRPADNFILLNLSRSTLVFSPTGQVNLVIAQHEQRSALICVFVESLSSKLDRILVLNKKTGY